MRGLWPCGLLFRWSVRSVRARAAEKAGEGLRGAAGAPCGEGRGRARRGWSGRGSSPARRSAWGHTLRDVEAPRESTGGPRPPGPQAGTGKGRMLPAIEWASSEGRDRAAAALLHGHDSSSQLVLLLFRGRGVTGLLAPVSPCS